MAEPFDPYYKWLGIAPQDQPPHHYRLLGLEVYEADPQVIDAAANRVTAYIKGCAQGPYAATGQKILKEISAARLCLLDERQKARYDAKLGQPLGESGGTPNDAPLSLNFAGNSAPAKPSQSAKPGRSAKRSVKTRSW